MTTVNIIAIDGPASSGKSTVAKMVAARLGWIYVTTGAIYRALALLIIEENLKKNYKPHIRKFIAILNTAYRQDFVNGKIFLEEKEITSEIKNPSVSELASILAEEKEVREGLLPIQRKIVLDNITKVEVVQTGSAGLSTFHGATVDGRDIGTVVFPNAVLKIFLTASVKERAKRRSEELKKRGKNFDLQELLKEINERDERDISRILAPLMVAKDAVIIDSTNLNAEQIVDKILQLTAKKNLH